jgi:hypothetical protein
MALQFPPNPSTGDTFDGWTFDGTMWKRGIVGLAGIPPVGPLNWIVNDGSGTLGSILTPALQWEADGSGLLGQAGVGLGWDPQGSIEIHGATGATPLTVWADTLKVLNLAADGSGSIGPIVWDAAGAVNIPPTGGPLPGGLVNAPFIVNRTGGTAMSLAGDGSGSIGNLSWNTDGNFVISSAGNTNPALSITSSTALSVTGGGGGTPSFTANAWGYFRQMGANQAMLELQNSAGTALCSFRTNGGNVSAMSWNASGSFYIGPPTASVPSLTVRGIPNPNPTNFIVGTVAHTLPNQWLAQIGNGGPTAGLVAGCSNGMWISAGTNATDMALQVRNDADTVDLLALRGDGSGVVGPAAGSQFRWTSTGQFTCYSNNNSGPVLTVQEASGNMAFETMRILRLGGANWRALTLNGGVDISAPYTWTGTNPLLRIFTEDDASPPVTYNLFMVTRSGACQINAPSGNVLSVTATNNGMPLRLQCGPSSADLATGYNGAGQLIWRISGGGTMQLPLIGTTANAANMYIDVAAGIKAIYQSTSSRRYKRDIRQLTREEALAIKARLSPAVFKSMCEADDPSRERISFIAEDAAAAAPELATYDAEGRPQGIDMNALVAVLWAAT